MNPFVLSHRLPTIARRGTACPAPPHARGAPLHGGDCEAGAEVGVTLEHVVGGGQQLAELRQLTEVTTHSYLINPALGPIYRGWFEIKYILTRFKKVFVLANLR